MSLMRLSAIALAALALSLAAPAAHAVTFTFANPLADLASDAADCGGGDVCGEHPYWERDGLRVTATVFRPSPAGDSQIIQDLSPALGGLGVVEVEEEEEADGELEQEGNDNVNAGEAIRLHFSVPVFLNTVTFNGDHVALPPLKDYLFRVDSGSFGERNFGDAAFGGLPGQDFYFKWGGDHPTDFYVASIDADPVPEPGTLMLMGMGLVGLAGRARKRLGG